MITWLYIINTHILGELRISDDPSRHPAPEGTSSTVAEEIPGQTGTELHDESVPRLNKSELGERPKETSGHLQSMNPSGGTVFYCVQFIYS